MDINKQLDSLLKRTQATNAELEDERLLELFRKRAELKKEFTRLQDENYHLQQQLKQFSGSQQAHGQRLQQLEAHLGNPDNGPAALVYYQLRALWNQATQNLASLCRELTDQQRERERKVKQIEFDQARQHQLGELEQALLDKQSQMDVLDARIQLIQRQLEGLRWFWNRKKRQALMQQRQPLLDELAQASAEFQTLSARRDSVLTQELPGHTGLSVEGKRLVNTAVLAYAQLLVNRFGDDGLAVMAKEASTRDVFEAHYGDALQCQQLLLSLADTLRRLSDQPRELDKLKAWTQRLRTNAFYRSDHETVPVPESIGSLPIRSRGAEAGQEAGGVAEEINVLLDDYWELYSALLH
jgi:hypothetical protein